MDLLDVLQDPPYEALSTGDHRGIIFGVEGVDEYARNLWRLCLERYRLCLPREYLDSRRAQILWALAVREHHPELFRQAWLSYQSAAA